MLSVNWIDSLVEIMTPKVANVEESDPGWSDEPVTETEIAPWDEPVTETATPALDWDN